MPDGSITVSGGVRVAWSNPARDGPGLCRQLLEQRECGRGEGSDETGAIVCDADGQPLYAARSLLLSRELLDAIASRGFTHIRFAVKDAALEWPLSSMPGDDYMVRLAPLEGNEWSGREMAAIEGLTVLSQGYRVQIVERMDGGEMDVTKDNPRIESIDAGGGGVSGNGKCGSESSAGAAGRTGGNRSQPGQPNRGHGNGTRALRSAAHG